MSYAERAGRFDADLAAAAAAEDSDGQLTALLGRPGLDEYERIKVTAALGESGRGQRGRRRCARSSATRWPGSPPPRAAGIGGATSPAPP